MVATGAEPVWPSNEYRLSNRPEASTRKSVPRFPAPPCEVDP